MTHRVRDKIPPLPPTVGSVKETPKFGFRHWNWKETLENSVPCLFLKSEVVYGPNEGLVQISQALYSVYSHEHSEEWRHTSGLLVLPRTSFVFINKYFQDDKIKENMKIGLIIILFRTFLGKTKMKKPINRLRRKLGYNIKMDLK
jgi:hypothetical protein